MGSKGLGGHARIRGGGGAGGGQGGGGGRGYGPHRKITRYMGRSRSKTPPAPGEISWYRAWGGFISLECIRTDCLMEDQAQGVTLYQLGAWDWLKIMAFTWLRWYNEILNVLLKLAFWALLLRYFASLKITCIISLGKNDIIDLFLSVGVYNNSIGTRAVT